ncbi:VWA domain-containing protein, partial [Nitratireductor sp.]|uniref:beta strand repeat-containing protein n=1 Tax=Nitratireductor sp. TaxID=1872084 RepID=UPI00261DFEE9
YSYTPTAGMSVPAGSTDVFTYTVIDADGDTATAELTITFSGDAFAPSATNQTTSLSDVPGDDSVAGSHADGFAPQSDTGDLAFDFGGDGPGGFVSAVYDGALGAEVTNSSAGGVTTITTDYWTLEINETTGAYTFTQTAAYPHAPGTATDQGSVAVTIEDSDGSTAVATITLNIGDDVPTASNDANGAAENGAAVLGNVLDNDDLGADHGTVGTDGRVDGVVAGAGGGVTTGGTNLGGIAGTYGELVLNADGTYSYTPTAGMSVPAGSTDVFTYTVIDADGDTATAELTITFSGDSFHATAGNATALVDEDDLATGNNDAAAGDDAPSAQPGVLPHNYGPDGAGSIKLVSGGETVNGVSYTYTVNADGTVLTANDGTQDVFRVTLTDAEAGTYTVELLARVEHDNANGSPGFEDNLDFTLGYEVYDADDATGTPGTLTLTIDDDIPVAVDPEQAVLSNSAGAPQEFDLDVDGMVTDNYGADGAGTVRFTVTDGQDSGLTSGGQPVTYHLSAGGTVLTAKVGGAGGTTVFTVTLDPADGTYTVDMDRPVDAFTQVDFDPGIYDFVGGNDPWAGFVPNGQDGNSPGGSPVDDNSRDLLLTPIGASGSSINGNAASAGVGGGSGGQNIGAGEGIRLDFVQDLTGDPAGSPADYQGNPAQQDHLFDGHYTVNGAAVTFGDGSTDTTIQLSAFDDPDGNTTVGDGTGDDITSIVIAYDGENQVITYDPLDTYPTTVTVGSPGGLADRSYTVDFVMVGGARVAQVTGVLDTQVTITSFTADGYNSLEVLYISGDDFAMTGFGTSVVSTDPVDFTLPIEIVDGDGDTAPAEIDLTLQPDAAPTISAFTAEVNEAGLAGGSEEGTASTVDTGALSIALASGDTLDTLEVSDANGNWVDVTGGGTVQGKFGLLTVTANGSGGYSSSYQLNQNSLDHNVRPGKGTPEGVAERFNVRAKDNDGDYSAVDTLKVNVLDDAPEAVADHASLTLGTENFNIAFVLDFSGSVSNSELDAMLDAVKAAGQAFFDGTSGNVQIELVAFSSSASAAGPFNDYASFAAQIDDWNPTEGGSRPYNGGTDFTAAIEETMDAYTPLSDHNNQVFFLSDGNPNEQIGAGGHSLYGSTQTAWNNFVQNNDVTVQTVGIGNNIDVEQLQDVDEADGSDVVVSVSNFDGLVTALLDLTNQVDVSGNVLLGNDNAVGGGDDDILGADDGRILSITVDGVTYTYQEGPDKIFNDGGQPAISGSSLVVDGSLGGELSFNFETGAWSYQADGDTTPGTESFDYVLVDNDGDTSGASLTIDILPPPGATDDVVLTNITDYSAIDIPTAALLHNDPAPAPASPLSVDGASNPQNGGVSLAGDVTFTPSSTPVEFVDEDFSSGEGSFVYRDAYYPGTGSEARGFQTSSGPAGGGALKIELGDGGGDDRENMNGAFTRTFNLASAATVTITFDYYAMLTDDTDVGEDVRVLAGIDGEAFGAGGVVDELLGDSSNSGGDAVTGWKTFTTTIDLSAGEHTLALGGLMTEKTRSGEFADVYFDNVSVEYTPTPSFTSGGFDYSVSDGSGFTDDAHVSVTGVSGSTITGTDADEVLVGNDSGSTLLGMGGDDSLVGGDAADLLDGGEGDDLLIGGDGADVLIGGEGQNTYDLTDTDGAIDTVVLDPSALTGMNPDEIIGFSSEDVVDLTELVSLSTTSGENVGDFVRLNPGDGKELQVDADGTAGGDDWVTVATFDVPQTPASIKILYDDDGSDTSGTV